MADNTEGSGDAQITFKVKTGGDKTHTITMSEGAAVLDLKTTLAGEAYEDVPAERQRLIYSGRVMKNEDTLATYKIKPNNTIHMVKSAASNPTPQPANASSNATPAAVPSNMGAGVGSNPLAGLTGARYAGHVNLPSRELFGADGGMGAPPSDDQMAQMLNDPSMMQTMTAALDNPQFIDYMIQSNPQLRNLPNARDIIQSPFMRSMMTNPDMLRNVMRMQRGMQGASGASPFPAPGATDNTPADAAGAGTGANPAGGPPNPFAIPGMGPFPQDLMGMLGAMDPTRAPPGGAPGSPGAAAGGQGANASSQSPPPANPFAALFNPPPYPQGQDQPGQAQGQAGNPFGAFSPEMVQQMMQMFQGGGGAFGGGGSPAAPPDNRPPEERYADQLRQLNDMGFYDFDRNIAALRRSGGSVQGAVEHLLSS
ncbi:hypothetical protein ACHAQA_000312 [Verticillium albo-atrum]